MFTYKPHFMPGAITMIGCGGTGSRLMPMLGQLARTCIQKFNPGAWLPELPIFLIDGDIVEEKNLLRQNFIQKDIGQNKAAVLANRYSAAFGIPIYASTEFIRSDVALDCIEFHGCPKPPITAFNNAILILAVDSPEARRLILDSLKYMAKRHGIHLELFIVDAGNEDDFGQIRFYNYVELTMGPSAVQGLLRDTPKNGPIPGVLPRIPYDRKYYQQLGTSAQEKSCADLPQTLAINAMMATMMCCVVQNFLQLRDMTYNGLRFSMNGAMSTDYNTMKNIVEKAVDGWVPGLGIGRISTDQLLAYRDANRAFFINLGMKIVDGEAVMPPPPPPPPTPVPAEVLSDAPGVPPLVPLETTVPRVRRRKVATSAETQASPSEIEDLTVLAEASSSPTDLPEPSGAGEVNLEVENPAVQVIATSVPPLEEYRP